MPQETYNAQLNLVKLDEMLSDPSAGRVIRMQEDHYMLVIPNYHPQTRKPLGPLKVDFSREGVAQLVEGLQKEKAEAEKKIANVSLLVKKFDELDAAEG